MSNISAEEILQIYWSVTNIGEILGFTSVLKSDTIYWEELGKTSACVCISPKTDATYIENLKNKHTGVPVFVISESKTKIQIDNVIVISLKELEQLAKDFTTFSSKERAVIWKVIFGEKDFNSLHGFLGLISPTTELSSSQTANGTTETSKADTMPIKEKSIKTTNSDVSKVSDEVRVAAIRTVEKKIGITLTKKSNTFYTGVRDTCVLMIFSRTYSRKNFLEFWYGFHMKHKKELERHESSYIAYGAYEEGFLFLIPYKIMCELLPYCNTTINANSYYWHIKLYKDNAKAYTKIRGDETYNLDAYLLEFSNDFEAGPIEKAQNSTNSTEITTKKNKIILGQGIHEVKIKK